MTPRMIQQKEMTRSRPGYRQLEEYEVMQTNDIWLYHGWEHNISPETITLGHACYGKTVAQYYQPGYIGWVYRLDKDYVPPPRRLPLNPYHSRPVPIP
jgi:hypothetical protein